MLTNLLNYLVAITILGQREWVRGRENLSSGVWQTLGAPERSSKTTAACELSRFTVMFLAAGLSHPDPCWRTKRLSAALLSLTMRRG